MIILKLCDIVSLGLNECPIYTLTMLLVLFLRNKRDWFTLRWILRTNPEALTQTFSLWFGDMKIRLNTLLLTSLRKHHQSKINQKMSSKNNVKNVFLKSSFELIYCLTLLWTLFQTFCLCFCCFLSSRIFLSHVDSTIIGERAAKVLGLFSYGPWAGKVFYRVTPAVTGGGGSVFAVSSERPLYLKDLYNKQGVIYT